MSKEMFCPDCEQQTIFQKIAGKWTCIDCGYELEDEEDAEEQENNFVEEMDGF